MKTRVLCGFLLISFLAIPVLAQPELKVGQVVEIYFKLSDGKEVSCVGKLLEIEDSYLRVEGNKSLWPCIGTPLNNKGEGIAYGSHRPRKEMTGYRILKPAPRPEFSLPCIENKGKIPVELPCEKPTHLQWSIEQIVDELRRLRNDIEKGR